MKNMNYLDPGIYNGGVSIAEGDYVLVYPENVEAYIEVQIGKEDGTYSSIIMSKEAPRVHLHVRKHYPFIISHKVGILADKQPSVMI